MNSSMESPHLIRSTMFLVVMLYLGLATATAGIVGVARPSRFAQGPAFVTPSMGNAHRTYPTRPRHRGALGVASMSLSPDFAISVADAVIPSVASVEPVGVRNVTSRGTGFVVDFAAAAAFTANENTGEMEGDDRESSAVYLLTAAHVASPGTKLSVSFPPLPSAVDPSGDTAAPETFPASLVGRDTSSDLALIRIDLPSGDGASKVPPKPLRFAEADHPSTGTLAFACGFPSGMTGGSCAMTMGIVCGLSSGAEGVAPWIVGKQRGGGENVTSATNATDDGDGDAMFRDVTFVVTDASMAPGMSGGPVADATGAVLGMCALVRPDLRALGNYAVSAKNCREFLERMERSTIGEQGVPAGFRVVLFNDRMNKRARVAQILRDVAKMDEVEATSVMMAAHTRGRGVLKEFYVEDGVAADDARGRADELCESMRKEDVLVEVEDI